MYHPSVRRHCLSKRPATKMSRALGEKLTLASCLHEMSSPAVTRTECLDHWLCYASRLRPGHNSLQIKCLRYDAWQCQMVAPSQNWHDAIQRSMGTCHVALGPPQVHVNVLRALHLKRLQRMHPKMQRLTAWHGTWAKGCFKQVSLVTAGVNFAGLLDSAMSCQKNGCSWHPGPASSLSACSSGFSSRTPSWTWRKEQSSFLKPCSKFDKAACAVAGLRFWKERNTMSLRLIKSLPGHSSKLGTDRPPSGRSSPRRRCKAAGQETSA